MVGASIYILRCADGSFYTGVTRRSVEERVSEHNTGLIPGFTSKRLPAELLFSETYERVDEAIAAERRLKGWSRAKKIAYMRGDFEALSEFSRSRQEVTGGPDPSILRQLSAGFSHALRAREPQAGSAQDEGSSSGLRDEAQD